jgi:hypothetical protein
MGVRWGHIRGVLLRRQPLVDLCGMLVGAE